MVIKVYYLDFSLFEFGLNFVTLLRLFLFELSLHRVPSYPRHIISSCEVKTKNHENNK